MSFLSSLIEAIIKMIIIGVAAFGGLMLGKFIRRKTDEKKNK